MLIAFISIINPLKNIVTDSFSFNRLMDELLQLYIFYTHTSLFCLLVFFHLYWTNYLCSEHDVNTNNCIIFTADNNYLSLHPSVRRLPQPGWVPADRAVPPVWQGRGGGTPHLRCSFSQPWSVSIWSRAVKTEVMTINTHSSVTLYTRG